MMMMMMMTMMQHEPLLAAQTLHVQ